MKDFGKDGKSIMENWRKYFQPHIWLRGMGYYEDGAVRQIHKTDEGCKASVHGSERYDVEIRLRGGKILGMSCTCPYADGGNTCKHMAAVLTALENGNANEPGGSMPTAAELASQIPEAALRTLMAGILEKDSVLFQKLLRQYGKADKTPESLMKRLQNELEMIPEPYEDRHGEIGYSDALAFACDIADFIGEQVILLVQTDSALAAANMGWEAVSLYCKYEVDDSDGGTSYVHEAIFRLYTELLALCSGEGKQVLYREVVKIYLNPKCHWIMQEISRGLLLSDMWGAAGTGNRLQFLDEEIARLEKDSKNNCWLREETIVSRLDAMEETDVAGRCSFMDAHLDVPEIRKRRAMQYLRSQDGEKAIRLLAEGKQQAKEGNYLGTECEFSHLLVDAYEQIGQRDKMLQEMEYHIFRYRQDDLIMLLRMKDAVPGPQWEELRSRYLCQKNAWQAGELMRHEEMWEALLKYVIESDSTGVADVYEADLKGRYPQEMLAFYRSHLIQAAEIANNRKNYYSLMLNLKKLCTYPGGAEQAAQLAADWRKRYRRRAAMLDELQKAGF